MTMRSSSELPDDVGTVFVTAVPGSKFQVLGRRDPRNGELCAGSLMMAPLGASDLMPPELPTPFPPEFVTGPEAERLVAEAVQHYTAIARRDGMTLEEFMTRPKAKVFRTVSDVTNNPF
jgi:hypothetical protein